MTRTRALVLLLTALLWSGLARAAPPPQAVSPGSPERPVRVADPCPTFSWGAGAGADRYELVVYGLGPGDEAAPVLRTRVPGTALSWTPSLDECLTPGGRYGWAVRAVDRGEASGWSRPALFRVVPARKAPELQEALAVVRRYLDERANEVDRPKPGSGVGNAPAVPVAPLGESVSSAAALGGADFSIDSAGNVAGASFSGDGSGLTGLDASQVVSGTLTVAHGGTGATSAEGARGNLGAVGEAAHAAHAGDDSAHHAPTVDTDTTCDGAACDATGFVNLQWGNLANVPAGFADGVDDTCTVTDHGDGRVTLTCDDVSTTSPREGVFQSISVSNLHSCGVITDDTVACWGRDIYGESSPRSGTFTQVSAGGEHTCAIKSDGQVACWGDDYYNQSHPPAYTFLQVSAGEFHNCGVVQTGGWVSCWGSFFEGQSNPPSGSFSQVSAGGLHSCGVRTDGAVDCWGLNDLSQSSPPSGSFTQISAGQAHTCGVRADRTLACWGLNDSSQSSPPSGSFTQVSAGWRHSCGLRTDGTLACWGSDSWGQATPATANAETLNSLYSSQFLRSDAPDIYNGGRLTLTAGTILDVGGELRLPASGILGAGSGSGLDADLLDGQEAAAFMAAGTDQWVNTGGDTMTGTLTLSPASGSALVTSGTVDLNGAVDLPASGITGAGPGSGLDADLLDGFEAAAFMPVGTDQWVNTGGDTMTGTLTLSPASGDALVTSADVRLDGAIRKGVDVFLDENGVDSVALGRKALVSNTTGSHNTAVGHSAIRWNEEGHHNTAVGHGALEGLPFEPGPLYATAVGWRALAGAGGARNVALGAETLSSHFAGSDNTAVGHVLGNQTELERLFALSSRRPVAKPDRTERQNRLARHPQIRDALLEPPGRGDRPELAVAVDHHVHRVRDAGRHTPDAPPAPRPDLRPEPFPRWLE